MKLHHIHDCEPINAATIIQLTPGSRDVARDGTLDTSGGNRGLACGWTEGGELRLWMTTSGDDAHPTEGNAADWLASLGDWRRDLASVETPEEDRARRIHEGCGYLAAGVAEVRAIYAGRESDDREAALEYYERLIDLALAELDREAEWREFELEVLESSRG